MKKLLLAGLVLVSSASVYAKSNDQFYVRADAGASVPASKIGDNHDPLENGSKFNTAGVYGAGVGYKLNDLFRTDLNLQYRDMNYKYSDATPQSIKQNTKNVSLFWNGYIDAKNSTIFTPYVTGGIGYSRLNAGRATDVSGGETTTYFGKHTNNFAWNVGTGSKVKLTDNVDLDLAYKYVTLGKVGFKSNATDAAGKSVTLKNHEVTLGITYSF